jgi:hypothetical protein
MGEWFLPFLHGWRSEAARLGKMAKKTEAQGAELSGRPGAVAFSCRRFGHSSPHGSSQKKHLIFRFALPQNVVTL